MRSDRKIKDIFLRSDSAEYAATSFSLPIDTRASNDTSAGNSGTSNMCDTDLETEKLSRNVISSEYLECPYYTVPSLNLQKDLLAIGVTLVSDVFDIRPPLIPGANELDDYEFVRGIIWEFSESVTIWELFHF